MAICSVFVLFLQNLWKIQGTLDPSLGDPVDNFVCKGTVDVLLLSFTNHLLRCYPRIIPSAVGVCQ